ncbi:unnamed protein product [Cochlearia groenlandica]
MYAMSHKPWLFPPQVTIIFFLNVVVLPLRCFSQFNSPQNIETFFPLPPPLSPPLNPSPPPNNSSSSSDRRTITRAVLITAAITVVIAALFFFLLHRCVAARRRRRDNRVGVESSLPRIHHSSPGTTTVETAALAREGFTRFGGVKGLIFEENGQDVLYWRNLHSKRKKSGSFKKEIVAGEDGGGKEIEKSKKKTEQITEIPLLRGRSSTSHSVIHNENQNTITPPLPPPSPPLPPPQIPVKQNAPPPPPPPIKAPLPSTPPPPPPVKKLGALSSSASKPPPAPRGSSGGENSRGGATQVKLKPLHWDKVNPDSDHSMVWDKIDRGSFSFDGDLMEALFGYVAVGKKSPDHDENAKSSSPSQIFILDPRKSQNTAIVLKSLCITHEELVESLDEGHDFAAETLERLARIAPTKEEQSSILGFDGDAVKLADAESFLFRLLRSVPTAFIRVDAFLFKANYYPEMDHHAKSLQTLDSACKELRSRGLFVKLLEAILKAGNRMNAGTARGNAQAFNLTALLKLSDVKSVDGKTTLLNFVVEEVVRSEGKRCVLNRRSQSLTRSNINNNNNNNSTLQAMSKEEEQEKEFLKLGLTVVGGLSSEFSNVKKAACVDYDTVSATCSALAVRAKDARVAIAECEDGGRFGKKMMMFLDTIEEEVKTEREEERKVMELVKRTTDYYQAGVVVKGKNPLHLFVIVRDFLGMVDKVCLEIMRNTQRRKIVSQEESSSSSSSTSRNTVKFPVLPLNFMSDRYRSDSDSDM